MKLAEEIENYSFSYIGSCDLLTDTIMNKQIANTQTVGEMKYTAAKNLRVFISDDSPVVRTRLANMISDIDGVALIGEAGNVDEAIQMINELKPNAVILDLCMPGGSGIDVLKEIKKRKDAPIVIVLTNYPFPQYRKICMDSGADYFFDKSNDFYQIVEIFKNLSAFHY